MMGRSVPGVAGAEGNQWTETATACLALYLSKDLSSEDIAKIFDPLYKALSVSGKPGLVHKKFTGIGVVSTDEVTFDDLLAFILLAKLSNRLDAIVALVQYGESQGWVLGNTDKTYFTAIARPWHIAAYKLAASPIIKPSMWSNLFLASYFVFRGIFRGSPSGIRMDRLTAAAVAGGSSIVDLGILIWRKLVLREYKTFSRVLISYYNNERHVTARNFPE